MRTDLSLNEVVPARKELGHPLLVLGIVKLVVQAELLPPDLLAVLANAEELELLLNLLALGRLALLLLLLPLDLFEGFALGLGCSGGLSGRVLSTGKRGKGSRVGGDVLRTPEGEQNVKKGDGGQQHEPNRGGVLKGGRTAPRT